MQYRPPTGLVWEARATDLAEVLARSQVHTILLAELWRPPTFLIPLSQIPTVQILQLKAQPWGNIKTFIDSNGRLKAVV